MHDFDAAFAIRDGTGSLRDRAFELYMMTNYKQLFDALTSKIVRFRIGMQYPMCRWQGKRLRNNTNDILAELELLRRRRACNFDQ